MRRAILICDLSDGPGLRARSYTPYGGGCKHPSVTPYPWCSPGTVGTTYKKTGGNK